MLSVLSFKLCHLSLVIPNRLQPVRNLLFTGAGLTACGRFIPRLRSLSQRRAEGF
jgi:hypothetical protein